MWTVKWIYNFQTRFLRSNITSDIDTLKRHGEIFNGICNLSLKFNRVFSVPVFVTLLAHFIIIISSLFIYVYGLVNGKDIMEEYNYILVTGSIFSSLRILILLSTADIPLDQVSTLLCLIFSICWYLIWTDASSTRTSFWHCLWSSELWAALEKTFGQFS